MMSPVMNQFIFKGYISIKTPLIQNIIAFVFSTTFVLILTREHFLILFLLLLSAHILIAIAILHKTSKSYIVLTENFCKICESKYFGVIKEHRQFEIMSSEKEDLVNYFILLKYKDTKIKTFSIRSLNELIKQRVIFQNNNLENKGQNI